MVIAVVVLNVILLWLFLMLLLWYLFFSTCVDNASIKKCTNTNLLCPTLSAAEEIIQRNQIKRNQVIRTSKNSFFSFDIVLILWATLSANTYPLNIDYNIMLFVNPFL